MNRTTTALALFVTTGLFAAACSGGDDEATSGTSTIAAVESTVEETTTTAATTTTSSTTTSTTPGTVPDVLRMPLTGEPVDDPADIPDRPALVVKISNYPLGVVPQAGLNSADIVFEEIINDGATRLAAVFHSQDVDPVGPVRSGRNQDINLLLSMQRPLFAWSGGNPAVTRAIRESDLVDLSALSSSGYYRRSGRSDANTLFSSSEALWAQTPDEAGRPITVFPYLREGDELSGDPATRIEVVMDNLDVVWEYDEETDGYFRIHEEQEHTTETADDVERVWSKNVVVMLADYGRSPADGNPDAQVLGANPVYVFTGGLVQQGEWLRFLPEDPFEFFDNVDDLNPLPLQPGRTWMEIPRNLDDVVTWE